MTIDPQIHELAQTTLTPKQLEVFTLIHTHGMSIRSAALHLGLARTTTIDRYDNACRKLHHHGVRFTPDGRPYLKENNAA